MDPAPIRAPCRTTSGALAGAGNSVALDINDHGQIVGYEGDQTTAAARALMWTAPPPEG